MTVMDWLLWGSLAALVACVGWDLMRSARISDMQASEALQPDRGEPLS